MKKVSIIFLFILLLGLSACTVSTKTVNSDVPIELNISAAASLKDALLELQPLFEAKNDIVLIFNFAASGTLQKQIEEGAPADIFISAATKQMEALKDQGLIAEDSLKDFLSNSIVLIASDEAKDRIRKLDELTNDNINRISIGTPDSVPAGAYAKESMENLGIWDSVESKIIFAKDVRQVLTYVETGEVDAGIVYSSDAALLKKGVIVGEFPAESHKPIIYPLGIIKECKNMEEAKKFITFLSEADSINIFNKSGFEVLQ